MEYLSWRRTSGTCLPAIDIETMSADSLIVGTKTKFLQLKPELMQVRRRSFFENRSQPRADCKFKFGVAAKVVMEDGNKLIRLDLLANERASLGGLMPKTLQGTWKKEATGVGFAKDGVMATFDTKKSSGEKFRIVLMLRQAEEGLILADIRARLLLEDKFSMLQSFKMKEENPLLRRVKFK